MHVFKAGVHNSFRYLRRAVPPDRRCEAAIASGFTQSWNISVSTPSTVGSDVEIGIEDIGSRKVGVV